MSRQTAIRGSEKFPQVVIKLLENSGGINEFKHVGNDVTGYYYINSKNNIVCNNPESVPKDLEKTELKFNPILYNTEMIQAILSGHKTQTRRVIKSQPPEGYIPRYFKGNDGKVRLEFRKGSLYVTGLYTCPYGKPGDILWVRETWGTDVRTKETVYKASADLFYIGIPQWKPSIHMPFEAARIFLRVKSVRVERLNDISEQGAVTEGVETLGLYPGYSISSKGKFEGLWNHIYGPESMGC